MKQYADRDNGAAACAVSFFSVKNVLILLMPNKSVDSMSRVALARARSLSGTAGACGARFAFSSKLAVAVTSCGSVRLSWLAVAVQFLYQIERHGAERP